MARTLSLLVAILGLVGCAGTPMLSESCVVTVVQTNVASELPDRSVCEDRPAARESVATLGSVRQTGSQTRTVGVPRGFLVAMIILIVLVGLV